MDQLFARKGSSKISLLGLGISNACLPPFFLSRGFSLELFDRRPLSAFDRKTASFLLSLPVARVSLFLGEGAPPPSGDILLRSPSMMPSGALFSDARARGARVTTEAGLFLSHTKTTIFGVTGSDGKSTTATLAAAFLRAAGKSVTLGGNIGTPLLPLLSELSGFCVMELSSFQLLDAEPRPEAAVITNLSENHLDKHASFSEYAAAKARLLSRARRRVLSADDEGSLPFRVAYPDAVLFSTALSYRELLSQYGRRECFLLEGDTAVRYAKNGKKTPLLPMSSFPLFGEHNRKNLLAAAALVYPTVTPAAIRLGAAAARPLPHRAEPVFSSGGVTFLDSSVDSSPARTAATLRSLGKPVILLLGGASKGLSYDALLPACTQWAKAVFLSGANAAAIEDALKKEGEPPFPVTRAKTFESAVRAACRMAKRGDTVLLSPASTSYDRFRNFEERGNYFARLVRASYTE